MLTVPDQGDVLLRPDKKRWKVDMVVARRGSGNALPTYMVYLSPFLEDAKR